jgi:hypothetical protein
MGCEFAGNLGNISMFINKEFASFVSSVVKDTLETVEGYLEEMVLCESHISTDL